MPELTGSQPSEIQEVFDLLRSGRPIDDADFDRVFQRWALPPSRQHWTPLSVARRAAQLLVRRPGARVLDVGAGVGKFCLVGASTTPGVFVGIEQRPHFHREALRVATEGRVDRCVFLLGNMEDLDWTEFDAVYLYNPFAEQRMIRGIDETIRRSHKRYRKYVRIAEEKLAGIPSGVLLATYHGFGGSPPAGWKQLRNEAAGTGRLEVWRRT